MTYGRDQELEERELELELLELLLLLLLLPNLVISEFGISILG